MTRRLDFKLPPILTGGLALFGAMTFANIINFLFQLYAGRELGPEAYGELGALTGVLAVFSVPSAALQVVITARVAGRLRDADGKPVPLEISPLLGQAVLWAVGLTVLLAIGSPAITGMLNLSSLLPAVLLAVYVLPTLIDLVPRAVLLGELRFVKVSIALIAGAAVRLLSAVVLMPSRGVSGAMAASVLGAIVTAGLLLLWVRPFVGLNRAVEPIRVTWRAASAAFAALFGFWILNSIDVLLGRHFLSANESGLYVAAATAASSALFVPGAVAAIALPRFAAAKGFGPAARASLARALAITGLLGGLAALFLAVLPGFVTHTLFGSSYEGSGGVLGVLAFSAAIMGLVMVTMQYHLSRELIFSASLSWIGIVTAFIGVAIFHDTLHDLAYIKLGVALLVFVGMFSVAFARNPTPDLEQSSHGHLWEVPKAELDLTMVVPYYNPGPLLRQHIERMLEVLSTSGVTYEVIAVSDGATDGSEQTLTDLDPEKVRSVVLPVNSGKGQALRTGFAMSRGNYVGFIDADGDVEASHLQPFISIIGSYEPDIILGSKRHPMSKVTYPPIRRLYSWGYQQLIRVLFRLNIRDTQTGLKVIRRDVLAQILPRMVEKRFAFDLELFVVARHVGFRSFFEAPITINHQFTSTISHHAVKGTLTDTLAIFYRLHILHYYDEARHAAPPQMPIPPDAASVSQIPTTLP